MDVISWNNPNDGGHEAMGLYIDLWISPSDTKCDFVLLMVQASLQRNRLKKSFKMCKKKTTTIQSNKQ